jgi:hypothetical protein
VTASDLVTTVSQADGETFVVLAAEMRVEVNGQPASRALQARFLNTCPA